jgi:hypothetical protein
LNALARDAFSESFETLWSGSGTGFSVARV